MQRKDEAIKKEIVDQLFWAGRVKAVEEAARITHGVREIVDRITIGEL